ncbi:hypothetical protein WDU94_002281 [Cyamophila willieti]
MAMFLYCALLSWCLMCTANGLNDVTTVYEINTFRSDIEDVKYLNTCTVSVHVPAQDSHLPLFNINSNGLKQGTHIPLLFSKPTLTKWKRLDGSEILPENIEERLKFKKFNMNLPPLSHLVAQKYLHDSDSQNMFDESVMATMYNNIDALPFNTLQLTSHKNVSTCTRLYWSTNYNRFIEIKTQNGNNLTVCYYNEEIECKEFKISFGFAEDNFSRFFVTLYGELVISDHYSPEIFYTNFHLPNGFTRYTRVNHCNHDDFSLFMYHLLQARPTHIASPWLEMKNNITALILYFAQPGYTLNVSLEDETTKAVVQLASHEMDRVNTTAGLERVLTKVNNMTWKGKKRIRIDGDNIVMGNIWEHMNTELDQYKIEGPKSCVKSKIIDIYNTLERGGTSEPVENCFNGGHLRNDTCACPPGFTGNQCELPCGRNRFGLTCSSICSKSINQCKGMILCTPEYGCTCAPGYYGDQCIEQCQQQTYGADCTQTCEHCKNGCDRYTGACRGSCSKPYLIRPYCKQTHSYLKKAPEIVNTSFYTVQLQVDLTPNNVVRSPAKVMFFLVQYREDKTIDWNDGPSEVFSPGMSNILVEGLNPGRDYEFRVILKDETRENQDLSLSKTTKIQTKCSISAIQEYLHVESTTNISIGLSWDRETGPKKTECPTMNYSLQVHEVTDTGYVKSREVVNIKRKSYLLEMLSPGQTYYIELKKRATNGETITVSSKNITTDDTVDLTNEVVGVTIKKTDSQFKIDWFAIPLFKKYFVKYKLIQLICCNEDTVKYPLEVKETSNTNLSLSLIDLEPYAYYNLFVTLDKNEMMKEFNSSFITPGTVPSDSPTFSSDPKVTNDSIRLFLTNYSDSCERMNGVFKGYRIELYSDKSQKLTYELKHGEMEITGLECETLYYMRIYFLNHVGFNPSLRLEHSFITKPNTLIRELSDYKTTATMIALRWKMPDISTILAIHIELRSGAGNKTLIVNSSLHSLPCKPWPGFYCVEVTGLVENTKYNITVDAFSKELPEGSVSKPILAVTKETAPSAVSDITLKYNVDTNKTLSWRIPYTLNGTLRSFDIQIEQLSSFDDKTCCQVDKLIYPVSAEQEIYSLTLQDIKPASSYQITIRPLAKRLGPEAKEIIETPPPRVPLQRVPLVRMGEKNIEFPMQNNSYDSFDNVYNTLATEILIIQQIVAGKTSDTSETPDSIRQNLATGHGVVILVCKVADVNCSVDVKPVSNEPGYSFKIILVQVNQYLSAKSYTILESSQWK